MQMIIKSHPVVVMSEFHYAVYDCTNADLENSASFKNILVGPGQNCSLM